MNNTSLPLTVATQGTLSESFIFICSHVIFYFSFSLSSHNVTIFKRSSMWSKCTLNFWEFWEQFQWIPAFDFANGTAPPVKFRTLIDITTDVHHPQGSLLYRWKCFDDAENEHKTGLKRWSNPHNDLYRNQSLYRPVFWIRLTDAREWNRNLYSDEIFWCLTSWFGNFPIHSTCQICCGDIRNHGKGYHLMIVSARELVGPRDQQRPRIWFSTRFTYKEHSAFICEPRRVIRVRHDLEAA